MNKARLRHLERLERKLSSPPEDDLFAPLWYSQWLAAFCAAADADMGRRPQWHHYHAPYLHHNEGLRVWLWRTLEDFQAAKGRLPLPEEIRQWIASARLAAAPWAGLETWPQQESLPCAAPE